MRLKTTSVTRMRINEEMSHWDGSAVSTLKTLGTQ